MAKGHGGSPRTGWISAIGQVIRIILASLRSDQLKLSFEKGEVVMESEEGVRYENLKLADIAETSPHSLPPDSMTVKPGSSGSCFLFFDRKLEPSKVRGAYIYINDRLQKFYEVN